MTEIDVTKRQVLTAFGVYQMQANPSGIGNECTRWITAIYLEDFCNSLNLLWRDSCQWGLLLAFQCGGFGQQSFPRLFVLLDTRLSNPTFYKPKELEHVRIE